MYCHSLGAYGIVIRITRREPKRVGEVTSGVQLGIRGVPAIAARHRILFAVLIRRSRVRIELDIIQVAANHGTIPY